MLDGKAGVVPLWGLIGYPHHLASGRAWTFPGMIRSVITPSKISGMSTTCQTHCFHRHPVLMTQRSGSPYHLTAATVVKLVSSAP